MRQSGLCIDDKILTKIFKDLPLEFNNLAMTTRQAPLLPGILDPPRNEYPLFEHLLIWLYGRWINPKISKSTMFGPALSTTQKTNLGEAMDYLIYSNFIPLNAAVPHRVSLLSLCLHEKFGFRDDPVLLQRMWYIRAFLLLEDNPNGAGPGERWTWYDHRMALVIYSWVRHNRKYHGCPKIHCPCRQIIDHYGLSIGMFKTLYMTLEKQCVRQLQFVRSNDPVWTPAEGKKIASRADEIKLYFVPNRKVWPYCFSGCVTEPDPDSSAPGSTLALPAPSNDTLTVPLSHSHHAPTAVNSSTLPPPHPSLPARPLVYTAATQASPPSAPSEPIRPIESLKWAAPLERLTDWRLAAQPTASILQPPPPKDSPPPPPPPTESFTSTTSTISRQGPHQNANPSSVMDNSQPRLTEPGLTSINRLPISSALLQNAPSLPPSSPAWALQPIIHAKESPTAAPFRRTISSSTIATSPDKRVASSNAARSLSGTPVTQSVIPSAPRSMREVKGASSGPIPTGPRVRTPAFKPSFPVGNPGRSADYAGVPSAPRSMREPKFIVTSGGIAGMAGNQPGDGDNSANLEKTAPGEIPMGSVTPEISSLATNATTPAGPKTSASISVDGEKLEAAGNALSASLMRLYGTLELGNTRNLPAVPPQATGKRSRTDTKSDEIVADAEMSAKSKVFQPFESAGPSTPTTQKQNSADTRGTPSPPPAKRLKTLPDSESSSKAAGKTAASKKSQAKDGAAILAAFTKQKGGPSTKSSGLGKDKAIGRSRKGAPTNMLVPEGRTAMDNDVEMSDASGALHAAAQAPLHARSSPQSTKTSSPPVPEKSKTKALSSVSLVTAPKKATTTASVTKPDVAVPTGSVGKSVAVAASTLNETIAPNGPKKGGANAMESRPATSTSSQSAQAILQAAANKKAAASKMSGSGRAPARKTIPKTIFKPSPEVSTDDNSSEDEAVVDEYIASSESDHISTKKASPTVSTQTLPRRQPSTRKSAVAATRSLTSEPQAEVSKNLEKEAAIPRMDSEEASAKQVASVTDEAQKIDSENADSSKAFKKNTKAGRKSIRELSRGKGTKKAGTPATTVSNDEPSLTLDEALKPQPSQKNPNGNGTSHLLSSTVHAVEGGSAPVESVSPTNPFQGDSASQPAAETLAKRKSTQKEKPVATVSQAQGSKVRMQESKEASSSKLEVIDLSSDDSIAGNRKNTVSKVKIMDLDDPEAPVAKESRVTALAVAESKKAPTNLSSMLMDVAEIVTALHSGPPFPTVLVQATDSEKRMQTAPHEARRLMCALIAVGVPMDWWMVGVTTNGFIIRDEAASLILPLLTEPTLTQLVAIGIMIQVTPAEPLSESDEEDHIASPEFPSKVLPSPLRKAALSSLVIFDGQPERRLRSRVAEEKKLRSLVAGILGYSPLNLNAEINTLDNSPVDGVVCLVSPVGTASQLSEEQISRLGTAGLSIYQGESQLAGPLPIAEGASISSNDGTFDWRAMRTEVMKMKLPWEVSDRSATPPPSSLYSPTVMSHSSSFTELDDSPADVHFRQLLRPNLWSTSQTFSRMAASGMRWGEFNGVDPELSDDSDEDDSAEQRLGTAVHV